MASPQKENLSNGAFVLSRSIFKSDLWQKPPEYLKIWIYLIGKANHKGRKYRGYYCERGQYFCDYAELRAQLSYKIGFRKKKCGDFAPKTLMKFLRSTLRITTMKKPRGVLITILNYDTYQALDNYEKTNEKTNEKTTKKPQRNQMPPSINKNYKELIYSPNSDEIRMSKLLLDLILHRNPNHRKPDLQKWCVHVHRMLYADKRGRGEVEAVIRWCQSNNFWQNIILNTEKLRKQYDQLKLKMDHENPKRFDE